MFVYHVTWLRNLDSIRKDLALIPSRKPVWMDESIRRHARDKVFFADAYQLPEWIMRYAEHAKAIADRHDPRSAGLVPIVLRAPSFWLQIVPDVHPNSPGYYVVGPVGAALLAVWTGTEWQPVLPLVQERDDCRRKLAKIEPARLMTTSGELTPSAWPTLEQPWFPPELA